MADYSKVIQLKPSFGSAWYNRGVERAHAGEHINAVADFNKAIQLLGEQPDLVFNRGISKAALKQYN
ncbi:hypothetical protein ABTD84_20510, partial [Acinetobacter baumannii]